MVQRNMACIDRLRTASNLSNFPTFIYHQYELKSNLPRKFKKKPWTSSLLWALQFAVRKTKKSAEHELKVCVLDTSRFITNTFFSASHLIRAFGLAAFKDCTVEYHTTTYLAHGSLNVRNCSTTVSLACLRDNGLFDLMP